MGILHFNLRGILVMSGFVFAFALGNCFAFATDDVAITVRSEDKASSEALRASLEQLPESVRDRDPGAVTFLSHEPVAIELPEPADCAEAMPAQAPAAPVVTRSAAFSAEE